MKNRRLNTTYHIVHPQKGFTLLELIIYIAISSMVMISAITIMWNIIGGEQRSINQREVFQNSRFTLHQINSNLRQSEDIILGSSSFGSHPSSLTLDFPGTGTDLVIDTYQKVVDVGGISMQIRKLRIKEGISDYVDLTTDQVTVSNFTLLNLTRGLERKNINISLTLERANPGGDPLYDSSLSLETATSLRK